MNMLKHYEETDYGHKLDLLFILHYMDDPN